MVTKRNFKVLSIIAALVLVLVSCSVNLQTEDVAEIYTTTEPPPPTAIIVEPITETSYVYEGEHIEDDYPLHYMYTAEDIIMLAKTVWGEARGCAADEQALVVWTVLNRVDDGHWGDTISAAITRKGQFNGYNESNPIDYDIHELCFRAVDEWAHYATAPTLPPYATTTDYKYFEGDGKHNWFRDEWKK